MGKPSHYLFEAELSKLENLATRNDSIGYLVDLGRGDYKCHIGRWVFHDLEEGIEGSFGQHMYFIDDIYFFAEYGGLIQRLVDNLIPDVVHSSMRCCVYLNKIKSRCLVYQCAIGAVVAWICVLDIDTIESLGHDPGGCCLARSPGSEKEIIGLTASRNHLLFEDGFDMFLSYNIVKILRTVIDGERHGNTRN